MKIFRSLLRLCISIIQVIVFYPVYWVSGLVPRSKRRVSFGCHLSRPAGNVFYFFKQCVEANQGEFGFVWVAANKESYDFIARNGLPVVKKNSLSGIWWCLSSGYYCYSSYVSDVSYFLSKGVRGVNVWHGTPLKKIESDVDAGIYRLRYRYKVFFKYFQPWIFFKPYRVFVSSDYEALCFSSAFCIDNNSMFKTYPPRLIGFERALRTDGVRHVLIAPTFRDGTSLRYDNLIDFERLDKFASEYSLVFHIKAHPSDDSLVNMSVEEYLNIRKVDRLIDIYSVVKEMDAVITDYSSIFFDCGYVGVPFFLHWPDAEFYNNNCRGFYFDAKEDFGSVYSDDMDGLLSNLQSWLSGPEREGNSLNKKYECYRIPEGYPICVFSGDFK